MGLKPMLAEDITSLADLKYPLIASPKLDGIRAMNVNGQLVSRSLKEIPNAHIQRLFSGWKTKYFDGELICGHPFGEGVYNRTTSAVMSRDGEPDVTWYVFDHTAKPSEGFRARLGILRAQAFGLENVVVLDQHYISCEESLLEFEELCLKQGYEGVIVRAPDGRYKFGRSTVREGLMLKVKRFRDEEFEVVGFEERMHNGNEAKINALGHTERSSHQENKTGRGDLGALLLKTADGLTFSCGTGFSDKVRKDIWDHRDDYLGKLAKVKHFPYGVVDKPRFPVFLGWRPVEDKDAAP
jgi:DNA ligase-1